MTLLLGCALAASADDLGRALDKILDAPALQGGITGAVVTRVGDGQVLYARNPDTRLMPASNRKLFTSAAALELLGDDFTMTTEVRATAKPDADGALHGDLYLKGGGDSLLSPEDLDALAKQVAKVGVRRITGSVRGDGSLFTDGPYGAGWAWDYLSDDYAPQIAGLEAGEGVMAVHVKAGAKVGDPVLVSTDPVTDYLPVTNLARTVAEDAPADCTITRPWDQNAVIVTGALPVNGKADGMVTVKDPARYAGMLFAEALRRHGVAVPGPALTGKTPVQATVVLASHAGLPLTQYIVRMNKPSDNLLAESLVRMLGAVKGRAGTYEAGDALEMRFFQTLGVDTRPLQLADGCGVSRRNFVTARAVTQLLMGMHRRADWHIYYNSLPIAGVDGTLHHRMLGTPAAGNVHAKTGTLGQACCLSGYITGKGGELYGFSLLMNNFPGASDTARAVQDRFAVYLAANLP